MRMKNLLIIVSLFMILLCCVNAISAASDDIVDDTVSEVASSEEAISVNVDEQVGSVDDSASLAQENDDVLSDQSIATEENGESSLDDGLKTDLDSQDSVLSNQGEESVSDSVDEICNDNDLLGDADLNHVYVSPDGTGDGSSAETPSSFDSAISSLQDNTVVHMADGDYTISRDNSQIDLNPINNIMIMANNPGQVILKSEMNKNRYEIAISDSTNITFKDITFQGGVKGKWVFEIYSSNGVYFENCTFTNYRNYSRIFFGGVCLNYCNFIDCSVKNNILVVDGEADSPYYLLVNNCVFKNIETTNEGGCLLKQSIFGNLTVSGCEFINNTCTSLFNSTDLLEGFSGQLPTTNLSIYSCVFTDNNANIVFLDKSLANRTLIFENNTVDAEYAVEIINGSILSPTLTVLNNTQLAVGSGQTADITFVLTDDKGNIIKIPKISFRLDNQLCEATYDAGVYHYSYTAPEVTAATEVYIDDIESSCLSNPTINMQTVPIIVKAALDMSAEDISDSSYGGDVTVKVNISNLESGNLIYEFVNDNGFTKNVTDSFTGNVSTITLNDLPAGAYTVNIKYAGDDFVAPTISKTFTVNKADSTIQGITVDSEIPVTDNISVQATVPSDYTGNITYTLNGNPITVNVGETAVFDALPTGPYTIYAKYNGDDNYNPSEEYNATFNIVKADAGLSISADSVSYGSPLVVNVNTNDKFTGDLTVYAGAYSEIAHITNGVGTATFADLPAGDYEITVNFTETEMFNADAKSINATVKGVEVPASQAFSTDVPSDSQSPTFSIKLDKDATGNFSVSVDGKLVATEELKDGSASITLKDLAAGTHEVTVSYSGDGKYAPITQTSTITIKNPAKVATKLTAAKVTATYNVAKKLVITLTDKNGKALANKKVTIKVGSISKTLKTNAKGKVSLNIAKLVPKTYTATVKFAGDSSYAASSVKPKVVVKKAKVKLAAKAKTFKAKAKVKKYIVTLKNNKGKVMKKVKLTLKVGKKTYKAKTNSKGKATFKIKKLTKKGKNIATIKFAGNKYFKAASKKAKIIVK